MKTLALLPLVLLTGCLSYQSKIKLPDGAVFSLPKDLTAETVEIAHSVTNVNGTVDVFTVKLSNVTAKMNPQVMSAKTRHDVALIRATVEGIGTLAGQAAAAAAKP